MCGLLEQNNLLCDPDTAESKGIYWIQRKTAQNCAIIHVPDRRTAQRIIKFCKGRAQKLHGRLLRVDEQHHDDSNMYWTGIGDRDHRPPQGDWCCEDRQVSTDIPGSCTSRLRAVMSSIPSLCDRSCGHENTSALPCDDRIPVLTYFMLLSERPKVTQDARHKLSSACSSDMSSLQGGCHSNKGSNSISGRGKAYGMYESEHKKQFSSGLQVPSMDLTCSQYIF